MTADDAQLSHGLAPGSEVQGYRILRALGAGGFGITYLAEHVAIGNRFAVKEFLPAGIAARSNNGVTVRAVSQGAQEDFDWGLERFRQEARTLGLLDHPNIVRVVNFVEANGTAYTIMDFVDGETLGARLLRNRTLIPAEIEALLPGLLSGLEAVHGAGLLHRDLKPDNIIVRRSGAPVLIDFGAARQALGTHSRSLTTVLSEGYAPYEQYDPHGNQGPWTDVYALGGTLYRCVTGERPVPAPRRVDARMKGKPDPLESASAFARVDYAPALLAAIDAALTVMETERPQHIAAFRTLLAAHAPVSAPPATSTARPVNAATTLFVGKSATASSSLVPAAVASRRGQRWALATGIAVLAAGGAVAGYVAVSDRNASEQASAAERERIKADEARRKREEEERKLRAEEAERRRIEAEIARHVAAAERAISAKDWAAAERALAEAKRLKPDHVEVVALEAKLKAAKEANSRPTPGRVFRDCLDCPEMVEIPAGTFSMGSPVTEAQRSDDEGPQHNVTIVKPFALGKYEVTFAEWDACTAADGCAHQPGDQGWGRGRRPVVNVSWDDAKAYIAWLSRKAGKTYRLPSEAEWEYAARAGTTTPFSIGPTILTDQANYDGSAVYGDGQKSAYRRQTVPVGSFAANRFGVHDMHGNVWEWVEDCWNTNYGGAPSDGRAWLSGQCTARVLRGGSWSSNPGNLRSATRGRSNSTYRFDNDGFRLARSVD